MGLELSLQLLDATRNRGCWRQTQVLSRVTPTSFATWPKLSQPSAKTVAARRCRKESGFLCVHR
jgi:hypothetical protein